MSDDPKPGSEPAEPDLAIDPRIDSPGREGLTGTAPADLYALTLDRDTLTIPPDQRPMHAQPRWRRDFAIDWPEDNFVARRDFAKFLVLISGAFVAGQAWIAAKSLVRHRQAPPGRKWIGSLAELPPGRAMMFGYPGDGDPCLLIRLPDGKLVAYGQKCTHLSCAVIPRVADGILFCPCHDGKFELATGRNIAGPPPRPLPRIELEIDGDEIYATGVTERTV